MAFWDDWGWVGDVVDWGAEAVGSVGDWFTGTEGVDVPFSDELLAPAVQVGSQLIGPRTQQGTYYPTNTATGLLSNFLGTDMGNILGTGYGLGDVIGTGLDIWGDYRDADLAKIHEQSYQDKINLLNQAQAAMTPYTDPAQRQALVGQEEERIMGLLSPYIERAAYRGRASDLSQGVGDSSIADWRDQERQKAVADLYSQRVAPTALSNVATAGTGLQNLYTQQASMLSDQPQLIQQQAQAAQQTNPWANMFLGV